MELIFQIPNETAKKVYTDDPLKEIYSFFNGSLPASVKFYAGNVSDESEIIFLWQNDIEKLLKPDVLYVIQYPEWNAILNFVIKTVVTLVVNAILSPKSAVAGARNRNIESTNESLGQRINEPRIGGADPYPVGKNIVVPDKLMSYRVFEDHKEVELMLSFIGVGSYEIDPAKVLEDKTHISELGGSFEVYPPHEIPTKGTPQLRIGDPITLPVKVNRRFESVNGQSLIAPNDGFYRGDNNVSFDSLGNIRVYSDNGKFGLESLFEVGTTVFVKSDSYTAEAFDNQNPPVTMGQQTVDLSGSYEIVSYTDVLVNVTDPDTGSIYKVYSHTLVKLLNPEVSNTDWNLIGNYVNDVTGFLSPTISTVNDRVVGKFRTDLINTDTIVINMVAVNGIYKDNGRAQYREDVTYQIDVQPLNDDGTNNGALIQFTDTIEGSYISTGTRAKTSYITVPKGRYFDITAKRTSYTDTAFQGTVVDEIQWRDLLAFAEPNITDYGDITLSLLKSRATSNALAGQTRKHNLETVSKVPIWNGREFLPKAGTMDFADLIVAITVDSRYGARSIETLDLENIYKTRDEIVSYFGTNECAQFSFTFSSVNTSYEEMIKSIASACFCTAYRLNGDTLKLHFDKERTTPTMLFNNENKIIGSESRSFDLGYNKDYDGVELKWKNPTTNEFDTISLPDGKVLINPLNVEIAGIRNYIQANIHANRAWNRLKYHHTSIEFSASSEANLLLNNDFILCANNLKENPNNGEITAHDGLNVTLSSPVNDIDNMVIQLQLSDNTVDIIPCTKIDANTVRLSRSPRKQLVTSDNKYVKTTYNIVDDGNNDINDFLVVEKSYQGNNIKISAINYDKRYYQNDRDHLEGI